jgi:hypothetical protein
MNEIYFSSCFSYFYFHFYSSNISNMILELVWFNELLDGLKSVKSQNRVHGQVTSKKNRGAR